MHEIQIQDKHSEMQCIQALIVCRATNMFIARRLLKKLGGSYKAAHIPTLGLGGQIMHHVKDSPETSITVQYMEHLAPVTKQEVLGIPRQVYELVLGPQWFRALNSEIDCNLRRFIHSLSPNGSQPADILDGEYKPRAEAHKKLLESGEDTPAPVIQLLEGATFGNLFASNEVAEALARWIGVCTTRQGAAVESSTMSGGKSRGWTRPAGSSGGCWGSRGSTWES